MAGLVKFPRDIHRGIQNFDEPRKKGMSKNLGDPRRWKYMWAGGPVFTPKAGGREIVKLFKGFRVGSIVCQRPGPPQGLHGSFPLNREYGLSVTGRT